MKARGKWVEQVAFLGETESSHAVLMDGAPAGGGRNLGPRPMEMLLLGESIDAARALEWGLVNRVVPAENVHAEALALAERIARSARRTVATGKTAFYEQIALPQHEAYAYTKEVMVRNARAADAVEGIGAFLEKRSPHWSA